MRLRKYLALLGVASLVLSFTGCSPTKVKEPVSETEATSVISSSIVKVKSCKFQLNDTLLGNYFDSCDIYLDTLTNTCFAKFHSIYSGIIVELLDNDGTPKLYSEENTNELVLVEQGSFLVFEDTDTGIQYVITGNYSDYLVRKTDTGDLYHK